MSGVRTVWTTAGDPDPRLLRVMTGIRGDAVARAVVGGVPVLVTAVEAHDDAECVNPGTHECEAAMVQVWDAAGSPVRTVTEAGGRLLVTTVVHGRPVAVTCGPEDPTRVVDLASGAVHELRGGGDHVQGLATAPLADGPAVVQVGWDEAVRILHLATGGAQVLDAGDWLNAVAVLGTGERAVAAVATRDAIGLWSVTSGTRLGALETPEPVQCIAVWPGDDRLLAALGRQGEVQVWDVVTGERRECRLRGGRFGHDLVAVHAADGRRLLALGDHEAVHVWDVDTDRRAGPPLVGPTGWCALVGGEPGVLVTASGSDDAVGVWRVDGDQPPAGRGHTSTLTCLAVTPDGYVVGGGTNGTVGSWRLHDGERGPGVGVLPAPVNAVAATAVGDSVAVLAGGGDMNATTDRVFHRWLGGGADRPVAVDHGGQVEHLVTAVVRGRPVVATGGGGPTVSVTDLVTGERIGEVPGTQPPTGLASRDVAGRAVLAVSRWAGELDLWDLAGGGPPATAGTAELEPTERVHGLVLVGDEPVLVTSCGELVRVRTLDGGVVRPLDPNRASSVVAVAVQEDKAPLVAVARMDATVTVVEIDTGSVVDGLTLPYPATALCWAPDGDLVVACRRDVLHVRR